MTNGLVFNHHSLPFANRYDAEANISEFIKICSAAKTQAQLTTILLDESIDASWFRVELCTGYCFRDWFTQNKDNDKDLIRIFRSIITNSPLFNADDVGGDLELFDVKEKTTQSRLSALRAALWYDRLLCSFPSKPPWNSNPLDVIIEQCHPGGELTEKTKQLTNLVTLADWDFVKASIIEEQRSNIRNGRELLKYCNENHKYLKFCGKSKSQLQSWKAGSTILQQSRECLISLNSYGEAIKTGTSQSYSSQQLRARGFPQDVSGESTSVRNDPKKKAERMFYLPDGRKEFFEQHAKLAEGYRLHFFPEPQTGTFYIGHIGPHLTL